MASAAQREFAPNEVFRLKPTDVHVGQRVGLFWPEKAAALGSLMQRDGQDAPIFVTFKNDRWELVAGLHRLQGARGLGLPWVQAIEVSGSADELLRIEVDENLPRRDFEPIERAMFIRAKVDLAEKRAVKVRGEASPQAVAAAARWEKVRDNVAARPDDKVKAEAEHAECNNCTAYGWSEHVAESMGLSRRSLFLSLKIHRQLIAPFEPELVEALARSPLGRKQTALLELADIADENNRRLIIDTIVGDDEGQLKSVSDAMIAAGAKEAPQRVVASGQTKFIDNAGSNLDRMTAASQRSFAPVLAEKLKPSALLAARAAIDARIDALGGADAIGGDDD